MADGDAIDVAPQNGTVPDTGVGSERYVANDGRGFGDENVFAKCRRLAQERVELFVEGTHAAKLTPICRGNNFEFRRSTGLQKVRACFLVPGREMSFNRGVA
jgi:hypothetical protein